MSIKELRKLKKLLLEANTPTKEEEVAKALRVIFHTIGEDESPETIYEGMKLEEAYKILGWCD